MPYHSSKKRGKKKKPMKGKKKKSKGLTAKQKKLPKALQMAILRKKRRGGYQCGVLIEVSVLQKATTLCQAGS